MRQLINIYGWSARKLLEKFKGRRKELFQELQEKEIPYVYDAESNSLYIGKIIDDLGLSFTDDDFEELLQIYREELFAIIYKTFDFWHPDDLPTLYSMELLIDVDLGDC